MRQFLCTVFLAILLNLLPPLSVSYFSFFLKPTLPSFLFLEPHNTKRKRAIFPSNFLNFLSYFISFQRYFPSQPFLLNFFKTSSEAKKITGKFSSNFPRSLNYFVVVITHCGRKFSIRQFLCGIYLAK